MAYEYHRGKCFRVILGLEINGKFASVPAPLQPLFLLDTALRTGECRGQVIVQRDWHGEDTEGTQAGTEGEGWGFMS